MSRLASFFIVIASLSPSSPAVSALGETPREEWRVLMHAYSQCVAETEGSKASEALLKNVDAKTIVRDYPMLIIRKCLRDNGGKNSALVFTNDLYLYVLADALVQREFSASAMPNLARVPALVHRDASDKPRNNPATGTLNRKQSQAWKHYEDTLAHSLLSRFGECIVRRDRLAAKALLATRPESVEETRQFGILRGALEKCLPESETAKFGKVTLRGAVALNYYRLAHAARALGNL